MYDEYGGEQAAYAAKYKSFTGASTVTDFYAYIDNTDPVWNDGPDRGNNHPVVNAYGVWKVGDPTAPVINLAHQPNQVTQLSKIVGEACWSGRGGVQRIYWGCCKTHFKSSGTLTSKSAQPPYTPHGLI